MNMDSALSALADDVAARTVKCLFDGRKGHGGGECSKRVMTRAELLVVVRFAIGEYAKQSDDVLPARLER